MRTIDCEQGSTEWLKARLGVITGTRLENAFKQSEALRNQLLAERMATYVPQDGTSKDMDRGNALEPLARKEYEMQMGCDVEEVHDVAAKRGWISGRRECLDAATLSGR